MSVTPLTDAVQHGPAAGSYMAMLDHARGLELKHARLSETLTALVDCYFRHRSEGMLELMRRADQLINPPA